MKISLLFLFSCCTLIAYTQSVKVNPAIEWQKSLGGTSYDFANSIQQTKDGGYITAGGSWSNDNDVSGHHGTSYSDYWIVKLDSAGNIQWQKSLGGSDFEYAYWIQQTKDGGYIIAGESSSKDGDVTNNHGSRDYWIVKLDSAGNIQWQKSLGGTLYDQAFCILQSNDGGYVIAGTSLSNDGDVNNNHGGWDCWVVKLDSAGNMLWQKSL
ncbi:MAG TPA: hypothetical protein PL045_07875, partial [Chitinophagaceae bacterium]|nr:hypothetical protein [Chitinophagaceae bacterium]